MKKKYERFDVCVTPWKILYLVNYSAELRRRLLFHIDEQNSVTKFCLSQILSDRAE